MKQQENMILSQLDQYKNMYLQANNENARLKHAVTEHDNELKANQNTIESMENRILALENENKEITAERDEYKTKCELECDSHSKTKEELTKTKEELTKAKEEIEKLREAKEAKDLSEQANVDLHSVVQVLQHRLFKTNSDATNYMKGEMEADECRMNDMDFKDVVEEANKLVKELNEEVDQTPVDPGKDPELPKSDKKKEKKDKEDKPKRRRNVFSIKVLDSMGIDTSNLPAGFKLIHRKDKITGEDVWTVRMYDCYAPLAGLEMLKDMEAFMPQSSLNKWMHEIMKCLRERLQGLMLEVIKSSTYTNNDETRILVRNLMEDKPDKYKVEYIHAALSLEKKLVVMLYGAGSRSHTIPEEQIFEHSNIKYFTADRAKLYETVVKDIEEKYDVKITRTACWFHARHYFVDAFIADHRVRPIIKLMNYLFYIERVADEKGKTGEARLKFRLKFSRTVVQSIMKALQRMKDEKDVKKYGKMVMRAVNYVLDDKEAFQVFLTNGDVEIHNIAIERCFRHIAMGRRNWGKAGSHAAAENLAFMYSLYESCKMNNLNFGRYIEDILTRMKDGDKDYRAMLPCYYVEKSDEVKECA